MKDTDSEAPTLTVVEADSAAVDAVAAFLARNNPEALILGQDVELRAAETGAFADKEPDTPSTAPQPPVVAEDDEDFGDTMSVRDQYEVYQQTCLSSPPATHVFCISRDDELRLWNELQSRTIQPGTKAGNLVIQSATHFHDGKFYVVASVRTIKFQRLV